MEDPRNIGMVCDAHAPKPDTQYKDMPLEFFNGKHVKLAFPCDRGGPTVEHMWVKVLGICQTEDEELAGILDNDPAYADAVRGDMVSFDRSEIEAVYEDEVN